MITGMSTSGEWIGNVKWKLEGEVIGGRFALVQEGAL